MPSFIEENSRLTPSMASIKNWISAKMGNQTSQKAISNRKHVMQSWNTIYEHDPRLLDTAISEAWLEAAELTPTWVWAMVDLPETMHSLYYENQKFVSLIQDVREFLHTLIKVHRCDHEMVKTLSFRLGSRHVKYMNEGHDNAYWHPFATQLPPKITQTYFEVINNNNKLRKGKLLRIRTKGDKSEEEELTESWREFMNVIIESIKRGYEGCPSEKTALRLSLTNSIISMASFRSNRSRSASHFLDPHCSSPSRTGGEGDTGESTPPSDNSIVLSPTTRHYRSRSIFRSRPNRTSQEIASLRRLSSPNNPFQLQPNDFQILRLSDRRESVRDNQRRSLTLLANS